MIQEEEVVSSMNIEVKSHRERPIPPASVRGLYDHVGWDRPATEEDLAEVLAAGPRSGLGMETGSRASPGRFPTDTSPPTSRT